MAKTTKRSVNVTPKFKTLRHWKLYTSKSAFVLRHVTTEALTGHLFPRWAKRHGIGESSLVPVEFQRYAIRVRIRLENHFNLKAQANLRILSTHKPESLLRALRKVGGEKWWNDLPPGIGHQQACDATKTAFCVEDRCTLKRLYFAPGEPPYNPDSRDWRSH